MTTSSGHADATVFAIAGRYIREFQTHARQLSGAKYGGQWWKMGVPATVAAEWANLGYTPGEAAPLIAAGDTPEKIRAAEEAEAAKAGNPDEHAAQTIDAMVAAGILVDPSQVHIAEDPNNPGHTTITAI